jgi:RNA polymerase sigma-70 factor (ECF subfamily)
MTTVMSLPFPRLLGRSGRSLPASPAGGDLLERIARGDRAALAELYDRHGRLVFSLARRILGDDGLAEEVTQDVFLSAWQNPGAYDGERGSGETWLAVVTRSRALDRLRRERRRRHEPLEADEIADTAATGELESVVTRAWEQVRGEHVRAAVARLSPAQREPLELAYFGGLTQAEIADRLGEPLGTIKTRMYYGMQRLGDALREEGIEP